MSAFDYRVVALDLDGTVLDSRGNISPKLRNLVASLADREVMTVICTGRRWRTTLPVVEEIENAHPLVVCCGGALIKKGDTHATLHRRAMSRETARETIQLYRSSGLVPFLLYDRDIEKRELVIPGDQREAARQLLYVRRNIETVEFFDGDFPAEHGPPLEVYTVDDVSLIREA